MPAVGSAYIAHVDGLRALAVLAVIAYHLREHWLPGGFAGVDVFFVISGFVVSASVSRWGRDGLASFLAYFYSRRLLRIAPALVVCLVLTAFACMLVVPFAWLSASNETTGLYAFFGLANLHLASQRESYFAPAAEFNPYTHTWSLGVEEQFYLLFPLLFFAWTRGRRGRQASIGLFALLFAASFGDAFLRESSGPAAAFYLTTSRLWEIAAGVLLFQYLGGADRRAPMPRAREALAWLGIAGILATMVAVPAQARPGAWPVVLATLVVLWSLHGADRSSALARVLGSGVFRYIGKRSYSLYLWHWPVFVLMRWTVGLDSPHKQVAALVATFVLAGFSFRWIESPWRHARWFGAIPRRHVIAGGLFAICACAGLAHAIRDLGPHVSLSTVTRHAADWYPDAIDRLDDLPDCHLVAAAGDAGAGGFTDYRRAGCAGATTPHVFALGDSHALAYRTMLTEHVLRSGAPVRIYDNPGCSFASLQPGRNAPSCSAQEAAAVADILGRARAGDVLFLAALRLDRLADQQGGALFDFNGIAVDDTGSPAQRAEEDRVVAILQPLAAAGLRLVFEAPKPVFPAPAFRCIDRFNEGNPACRGGLSASRAAIERYRRPALAALERVVASIPGAAIWDPLPLLCTSTTCNAVQDGRPLFFDGDHPSAHANRVLYPSFAAFVAGSTAARSARGWRSIRAGLLIAPFLDAAQELTRMLVGATLRVRDAGAGKAPHFPHAIAFARTCFGFGIQPPRDGRRATLGRKRQHEDFEAFLAARHAQAIAGVDEPGRLRGRAADVDLAAVDRLPRKTACLEEARGPQPDVEADGSGRFGHRSDGTTTRAGIAAAHRSRRRAQPTRDVASTDRAGVRVRAGRCRHHRRPRSPRPGPDR